MVMTEAPRDAIGLSDRLRERIRLLGQSPDSILKFMDRILPLIEEAATALDALQARVKELEANMEYQARAHSKLVNELEEDRVSGWNRCREAESQRDVAKAAADTLRQQRDEAYERAAKVADQWMESSWADEVFAARSIAAAIRRLAAGTEKEGE
jgi:hypothetical protein